MAARGFVESGGGLPGPSLSSGPSPARPGPPTLLASLLALLAWQLKTWRSELVTLKQRAWSPTPLPPPPRSEHWKREMGGGLTLSIALSPLPLRPKGARVCHSGLPFACAQLLLFPTRIPSALYHAPSLTLVSSLSSPPHPYRPSEGAQHGLAM